MAICLVDVLPEDFADLCELENVEPATKRKAELDLPNRMMTKKARKEAIYITGKDSQGHEGNGHNGKAHDWKGDNGQGYDANNT